MHKTDWGAREALLPIAFIIGWLACVAVVIYMADQRVMGNLVREVSTLFAGILAGLGALLAALIAYLGATSKTRFDREIDRRDRHQQGFNLMLKVEHGARTLIEQLEIAILKLNEATVIMHTDRGEELISAQGLERFEILLPRQVSDAWESLSLLPPRAVSALRTLTLRIEQAHSFIERVKVKAGDTAPPGHDIGEYYVANLGGVLPRYRDALQAARVLVAEVELKLT